MFSTPSNVLCSRSEKSYILMTFLKVYFLLKGYSRQVEFMFFKRSSKIFLLKVQKYLGKDKFLKPCWQILPEFRQFLAQDRKLFYKIVSFTKYVSQKWSYGQVECNFDKPVETLLPGGPHLSVHSPTESRIWKRF